MASTTSPQTHLRAFLRKKSVSYLATILVFLFSAAFLPQNAIVQTKKVVVVGQEKEYADEEIEFFTRTDYITQQREVLAKTTVAPDGAFRVEFPLFETQLVMVDLGVYTCYMYMEAGKSYRVAFPPRRDKTESERLNPYFDPVVLQLRDLNGDGKSTNDLIARFDAYVDSVSNATLPRIADRDSLISGKRLVEKLKSYTIPAQYEFANQYKEYRIGLMSYMTETQRIQALSKTYFQNRSVLHRNPAYMELFNIVYDKYLVYHGRTEDGQQIYNAISKERNYTKLKEILAQNDHLTNDTLCELVILKGLYDEFFSSNFSRNALFSIVDSIYSTTDIPEHTNIAQQIRERISKFLPGFIPYSFTLKDAKGQSLSLKDFRGYMVLLCFCTTTSYSCIQDFDLLNRFQERYSEHLRIISICADQDSASMHRFVKATHYQWTFLHYGDAPNLIRDYDVRTYPTYFLLDPEGRIILSPAPGPQENLERILFEQFRQRRWQPRMPKQNDGRGMQGRS